MARWLLAVASTLLISASLGAQAAAPQVRQSPPSQSPGTAAPRDSAPTRPQQAPALLRGTVTAAGTGQRLHRASVTLTGVSTNPLIASTDDRGEYVFASVPPGAYTLTASRAGYLPFVYGQRRPGDQGRRVDLAPGQQLADFTLAMTRSAVVAGRIIDDAGEPFAGVRVEVLASRYVNGRRVAVPIGLDTTDDIGEYRVSGLGPGTYVVRASTTETWPEGDGPGAQIRAYAPTYFPGGASSDRADSVRLTPGQEASGIDITMLAIRASRVGGRVQNAAGEPLANHPVNISKVTRTINGALMSTGGLSSGAVRTNAQGEFEFVGMPSGEYLIGSSANTNEGSTQTLILTGADVTNLLLTPRRNAALTGIVVTDDNQPPPFPLTLLRVVPIPIGSPFDLPTVDQQTMTVRADGAFSDTSLEGRFLFRLAGLPDDWMLQTVDVAGSDVTNAPIENTRGGAPIGALRLVITRKASRLTGVVADAQGAPIGDTTVIVFADAAQKWGAGSLFVRTGRPNQQGRFSIGGLRPGAYLVAARDFVEDGEWEDAAFLERLRANAVAVTVGLESTVDISLSSETGR